MKVLCGERTLIEKVVVAKKFAARLQGLMFKKQMPTDEGFFIPDCNWVHTFFMRFPIDVVYLDTENKILHIDHSVDPWRFCAPRFKASHALELCSGVAETLGFKEGEILKCIS